MEDLQHPLLEIERRERRTSTNADTKTSKVHRCLQKWKPWLEIMRIGVEVVGILLALVLLDNLINKTTDVQRVSDQLNAVELKLQDLNPEDVLKARNEVLGLAQNLTVLVGGLVPTGTIAVHTGSSIPAGWLLCDGQAVLRSTYSALFAIMGGDSSPFGNGDGLNTFNVPDLRDRVPIGVSAGSLNSRPSAQVLGSVGGEEAHSLSIGELASHQHPITDPGHSHGLAKGGPNGGSAVTITTTSATFASGLVGTAKTGITGTANTGLGNPHNVMQPYLVVNWIIKT